MLWYIQIRIIQRKLIYEKDRMAYRGNQKWQCIIPGRCHPYFKDSNEKKAVSRIKKLKGKYRRWLSWGVVRKHPRRREWTTDSGAMKKSQPVPGTSKYKKECWGKKWEKNSCNYHEAPRYSVLWYTWLEDSRGWILFYILKGSLKTLRVTDL